MRRLTLLLLLMAVFDLAWAQACPTPRMTPPDYPELPEGRDPTTPVGTIDLSLSPNAVRSPDQVSVSATAYGAVQWTRIRWDSAKKGLGDTSDRGQAILSDVFSCGPSVKGQTRLLEISDNGQHRILAEAEVFWKVWVRTWICSDDDHGYTYRKTYGRNSKPPHQNCRLYRESWEVKSGLLKRSTLLAVYISWDQGMDYNQMYEELVKRLDRVYRDTGGRGMGVDAFAKEVKSNLKGVLTWMASGDFVDCDFLGICRRLAPVRMRWLTDVPDALRDMIRRGRLCGGEITFCFEPQDSRVADIGPRIEIKSFIMIRTPYHDYILMDRLIPRRYYDPGWIYRYPGGDGRTAPKSPSDSYDAVPEEERQQVLKACRAYMDTQEGRRCATVVEVPGGIVSVLRQALMVDFLFQNSREVQ